MINILSENFKKIDHSKYRVLQLTKANFPTSNAIRVVKESLTLQQHGYTTAVLCPPINGQPAYELWEGIEIYRLERLGRRSLMDRIMSESIFFSPAWYQSIREIFAKFNPHILHIHDIWLGKTALLAAENQKIIFDLHENMPAAVKEYTSGHSGLEKIFRSLFHQRGRIFTYEKKLLNNADLILSVVEEARQRIIREHPEIDIKKVKNIENLESKKFLSGVGLGKASFEKKYYSILYIGGFGPHRGIETLIRAMIHIKIKKLNYRLHLIGAQKSQYLTKIINLIKLHNLDEQVNVVGWVSGEDVIANILQADLCCVPHNSNPHTDSTIPHKLYQYMILKKPILVSSSTPLARTIKQARAGLIFKAGDDSDCANKIIQMASNGWESNQYSINGYQYVIDKGHNWEEESEPLLLSAYDELQEN